MLESTSEINLPGLNCGLCGYRTCDEFRTTWFPRRNCSACIHLSKNRMGSESTKAAVAESDPVLVAS